MKQVQPILLCAAAVVLVFGAFGIEYASADQAGWWSATPPTEGSPPVGYVWELNIDGNGWAALADTTAAPVLPFSQLPGTVVQTRLRAYDYVVAPVMEDDLLVGVERVRRYGPYSANSDPNENNEGNGPGGCGKPFWTAR